MRLRRQTAWHLALVTAVLVRIEGPSFAQQKEPSPVTIEAVKKETVGTWVSIAPEVRPSGTKAADGSLKPFYLKRVFKAMPDDTFELEITNFADPYGAAPIARIFLAGHMKWHGEHPIAPGARKVDFIADKAYVVTPLAKPFADVLNAVASAGFDKWDVNAGQSVLGKSFPPFGLKEGATFSEFDLVYVRNGLLFWGARHVDGRGFDTEQNRPTNLQIPLVRQ